MMEVYCNHKSSYVLKMLFYKKNMLHHKKVCAGLEEASRRSLIRKTLNKDIYQGSNLKILGLKLLGRF